MAIALLSLIENIRLRLDDLGGDRGEPTAGYYATWQEDDSGCLWKNTELVGYLKSALLDIAGRISLDNWRQLIRHRWRSNAIVRDRWKSRSCLA